MSLIIIFITQIFAETKKEQKKKPKEDDDFEGYF